MAIADYAALSAAAEEVAGRAMVSPAITLLTADLNNRLRVREMLKDFDQTTLAIPADMLQVETLKVGGTVYGPATEPGQARGGMGFYSVNNGEFLFTPPETAPALTGRYYAALPVLAGSESNAVLTRYPDVYLFGLLGFHGRLVRDDSAGAWVQSYESAIRDAERANTKAIYGNTPMRPIVGRAP